VDRLPDWILTSSDSLSGWVVALIILVGGFVATPFIKRLIRNTTRDRLGDVGADLCARLVGYLAIAAMIVYALDAIGVAVGPIIGALGIAGVAIAFALKDVLGNFVAGILLQIRRPFEYGDEVDAAGSKGKVVSVDSRSITIHTADGELIDVPSSVVIAEPFTNFTRRGQRRTSLDLGVAYGTDLIAAIQVLTRSVQQVEGVAAEPPVVVHTVGFGDSSIDLSIQFWHGPATAERWAVRTAVALEIDRAATEHAIDIPFPQRVIINA
jgi:small conductance mechanosensitive channel